MSLLSPLRNISHAWLPTAVTIIVVIAIILMVLVVILSIWSAKTAGDKKKPAPKPPAISNYQTPENKLPPWGGHLSAFLVRKGYFRVGELSLSFLRALQYLRARLDSYDYKYRLPWFVLLGTSRSGKSTLLEGSDLVLPVGRPDLSGGEVHPGCTWWFLNRAVILDIRGDFLLNERGVGHNERGWHGLLSLLTRYRSLRPLDGIILCIPADELYGQWRLTKEEIYDRAHMLGEKLRASQSGLGLRLPVYIIVTKCDTIPGFQSLCSAIPKSHRHDILGWSCPYTISTAFHKKWVDEAFDALYRTLIHLRLEIMADGPVLEGADGLFMLPTEAMKLKDPFSIYINSIFKKSAYEESLLLRGIYFVGDLGEQLDPYLLTRLFAPTQLPAKPDEVIPEVATTHRHIFFANDVLNERVFRESGLVEPIHKRLVTANRGLNVAKAAIIVLVTLGTYGLLRAYDAFTLHRDFLVPSLNQISSNIHELEATRVGEVSAGIEKFDNYAREMIEMMTKMNQAQLFSIFSPPSWFSSVDDSLKTALRVGYEEIIVRTLHLTLMQRAASLLHPEGVPEKTTSIVQLLSPMTMPEAIRLHNFTTGFIELVNNIEKYNHLSEANDAYSLGDLTQYAFGLSLPESFDAYYRDYRKVLRKVNAPAIDWRASLPLARQQLMKLYHEFLDTLMGRTNPHSLIGRINEIIQTFGARHHDKLPDVAILRRFNNEASLAVGFLESPGQTWMDGSYFDPGSGFPELMQQIAQSSLFGPQMVQVMAKDTSTAFGLFVAQLQHLYAVLNKRTVNAKVSFPSQSFIDFEKNLETYLAEPFMIVAEDVTFRNEIPSGKFVIWDQKLIDAAVEMTNAYDEFVHKGIDKYPPLLQNTLKLVAIQNLRSNIVSFIGRAQVFIDVPKGESAGVVSEEILRSKTKDNRQLPGKFIKLLETLEKDQAGTVFVPLRNMLSEAAYKMLTYVESSLQAYAPYTIRENNLDWWDGVQPIAFQGYAVKDNADLANYLKTQLDRMRLLGLEYADPMVTFLSSSVMQEAQVDKSLVNRWRRIDEQLQLEEKKRAESSVAALETFITKDLNSITMKNCFDKVSLSDVKTGSGDYFLEVRQKLRRGVLSRCEVLRRNDSMDNYTKLVDFFNNNMKGKIPFVGNEANAETAEVEPQDLRAFFKIYAEAGDSPDKILDQVYQLGKGANDAMAFLTSMEGIKKFFKTYLTDLNTDAPFVDFSVDFRVNRANEVGGSNVLEWYIKTSPTAKIINHDKQNTGRWSFDNPVEIGFRWPEGIDTKPFRDKSQNYMTAEDLTAIFRYPGRWSLLWLLKTQSASTKDLAGSNETKPYVLRFDIPTGPTTKATLFVRISLSEKPIGKKPGKMLKLPEFPTEAPALPDSVVSLKDRPVIAQGEVEAAEAPTSEDEEAASSDSSSEEETKPDEAASSDASEESASSAAA
ncbi:MAG: type VI secretion protein IcmF/TssM N-terminal domain-containing protein [Alphaproteobacteria bacterium]